MPTPHDTFREELLDLSYGELGRREERALLAHLETCPACRTELAKLEGTRRAMARLGPEPAPERGEAVLLAAAREEVRHQKPRPFLPAWLWGVSATAVAAAAVAVVSYKLAVRNPDAYLAKPADELVQRSLPAELAPPTFSEAAPAAEPAEASAGAGGAAPDAKLAKKADGSPLAAEVPAKPTPSLAPQRQRSAAEPSGGLAIHLAPQAAGQAAPAREEGQGDLDRRASADAAPATSQGARVASAAAKAAEPAPAAPPPPAQPETGARDEAVAEPSLLENREVASARAKGSAMAPAPGSLDLFPRHQRLEASGRLHTASASFPDCAAEASREVDLDEEGRVVKYTRRGSVAGAPFQVELFYGEDGRLGAVRYESQGRVREARLPGAIGGSGVPAFLLVPPLASEAGLDAPPRCGG